MDDVTAEGSGSGEAHELGRLRVGPDGDDDEDDSQHEQDEHAEGGKELGCVGARKVLLRWHIAVAIPCGWWSVSSAAGSSG